MKKTNRMRQFKWGGVPRRTNHKGFSLVELIVVVAIMAVLVGVLAPQYLRYVEKTRWQKDESAFAEIAEAIKIAAASEEIYNELAASDYSIEATRDADGNQVWTFADEPAWRNPKHPVLVEELTKTIGDSYVTQSTTYRKQASNLSVRGMLEDGKVKVVVVNCSTDANAVTVTSRAY